jgi:hypothetical protein
MSPADVYVETILKVVKLFINDVDQLRAFWLQEEDNRTLVGIFEGTDWYETLVAAHKARKFELGAPEKRNKWRR